MSSPVETNMETVPKKPPSRAQEYHQGPASMSRKAGYRNLKIANHIARVHGGLYIVLHAPDKNDAAQPKSQSDSLQRILLDQNITDKIKTSSHLNALPPTVSTPYTQTRNPISHTRRSSRETNASSNTDNAANTPYACIPLLQVYPSSAPK
jgi:hypothetical protein